MTLPFLGEPSWILSSISSETLLFPSRLCQKVIFLQVAAIGDQNLAATHGFCAVLHQRILGLQKSWLQTSRVTLGKTHATSGLGFPSMVK